MTAESLAAGHEPLLRELGELRALAKQVLEAHRAEDGRRLHELSALVADLLDDLDLHLRDEERADFAERRELRRDHAQLRMLLGDLRRQTQGYCAPHGACATLRELWRRLSAYEDLLLGQMRREEEFVAGGAPA